jgi:hypothetical protein
VSKLILVFVLFSLAIAAQSIRGWIAGSTAPGAHVRLTSVETARGRELVADSAGRFQALNVAPGEYTVEISAAGFATLTRTLALGLNQELELEAPLVRAGERQQVEVHGAAPLLRTESAAQGGLLTNQQIVDLPLDGRNYYELALLLPGVSPAAQGAAGGVRGDFAMSVNGARDDANLFSLDGAYNGDPKLNGAAITSPVDGIREFEVATSGYDASFSRNAGGQVNVASKSGSNSLHGTAYEFFRNGALDARNFFAPAGEPDPRYQRNQFGGSLGGPIRKDKTFFFADYESRLAREGFARRTNVPTAAERTGDFSANPYPVIDPYTQAPFPGNRIPSYRQDPIGVKIAALYPLPNRNVAGQNFASAPIGRDDSHTTDLRLDHSIGARDELMARYSYSNRDLFEPFSGAAFAQFPGYGNNAPRQAHNAVIGETHTFSPVLINEARLAFSRLSLRVNQQNQATDVNAQVGLPRLWSNSRDNGLSYITVLGYSPLGDEYNNPQRGVTNMYQLTDQVSWSRGAHIYKFGGEIRKLEQNAFRDVQSRGFINFIGFTGNALSELLQGLPAISGGARLDNPQHLRTESYSLFAQSTHKVTRDLTITAGARYEYNSPAVDPADRANLYDVQTGGLTPVGKNGMPRAGYFADRNNFGPRIGFAYSPSLPGTVIRGGYGIYFDQSSLAPSEGLYFNAPYFDFRLFFALPQLPLSLANPWPANFPYPTPPSGFAFDRNLRTPYVQQWSFGVQQQAGAGRVVELNYAGSKGTRLYGARDINQPGPSAAPQNPRPNYYFDDINRLESRSNSSYHSMQASARQQFRRGLTFFAGYTWAKSIDDASGFFPSAGDPNFPQDSRNLSAERGRSNFDVRHRLAASASWLMGRGFSLNGILTIQSGRPFTVALPSELDNSGTGRSSLGFGANDRPNVSGDARLADPTPERWFNTAAFALPARGTFGNAGRNILDGPGQAALNVSLLKSFRLKESLSVQMRAEAFNLLNHTNFDLPANFLGAAGFGSISSAQNPRHLQLGLKLLF